VKGGGREEGSRGYTINIPRALVSIRYKKKQENKYWVVEAIIANPALGMARGNGIEVSIQ
jgi:hypothetical protein